MSLEDILVQYYWINGNGQSFYLSPDTANDRYLVAVEGLGTPPIERLTSKRPYRHGDRRRGSRYMARPIDLVLAFRVASSTSLWSAMGDWAYAFNMELGIGTLKMILQDGTERRIDAEVSDQITMGSKDRKGGLLQFVTIALTADDPFLYNPTQQSAYGYFSNTTPVNISCTNNGDMNVWPTIEIAGSVTNPTIELVGTGQSLNFTYTVGSGNKVTVDPSEGTIELQDGTNLMDKIGKTDDFLRMQPGSNTVRISASSGYSRVDVKWRELDLCLHS